MNTVKFLDDRFIAISRIGKIQVDKDTPLADSDIDMRLRCRIALEDNIEREINRDCENVDRTSETIRTRYRRFRLTFTEVTAHEYALFAAYFLGIATVSGGPSTNEVQTLTRSGTVSSGFFGLALTLEGRTTPETVLPWNASDAQIEAALTAAKMKFIQPGDVDVVGGTKQVETLTVVGTCNSSGNLPVTVIAAGSTALAGAGKTIQVAITNLDTAAQVAGKIRAALAADSDVGGATGFFDITGATDQVILTAKASAANDGTMAVSYTTVLGMTGAASANTTAGVVSTSWPAGMAVTFGTRLGNADLPLLTVNNAPAGYAAIGGGGSIVVAETTPGDQYFHEFTRSVGREKVYFPIALGYLTGAIDPQKFSSFVCESFTPSGNRRQKANLEVTLVGPYDPVTMTGYTIPACENPTPMQSEDIRVLINSLWETTDISTLTMPFNDNVPLDDSAYGWDGIDPDLFARAKQVDYDVNAQIFAIETDPISVLAENERTQATVDAKYHFGMPGDRFTILAPETKIKYQTGEHFVAVGAAERMAANFNLSAFKNDQSPPISAEAYISQATAFLTHD